MGVLLTTETESAAAATPDARVESAAVPALPDDDETIRLAALAGRPTEARAKVKALVDAGAPDKDIAAWLAPLLVADPDWLDTFILTVPEDRRIGLVRVTFMAIGDLHPGSVWELLKHSPFAAVAAKGNDGTPDYKGLDLFWRFSESDQTAEVLFDPALGFTDEELARYFRTGVSEPVNAKRILDEWAAGRWAGFEPPECVRRSWATLRYKDPDFIAKWGKKTPASLQSSLANFQAQTGMKEKRVNGVILTDPTAEELEKMGAAGVKNIVESRGWDAKPIPLATLAQLSPEVRGPAIDHYFDQLYPFSEKAAAEAINLVDDLDLTPAERQSLLQSAASQERNERGDYATALELAARMPDAAARKMFERETWEEWAAQDPDGALAHVTTLPDGELKQRVEQLANESKP